MRESDGKKLLAHAVNVEFIGRQGFLDKSKLLSSKTDVIKDFKGLVLSD